jgi:ectoine hydroxylase-related dioxygenase (phytanoyl-CoA dioxygenase family)
VTEYARFSFDLNGYIILQGVLSEAEVAELMRQVDDLRHCRPDELPEGVRCTTRTASDPTAYLDLTTSFGDCVCISDELRRLMNHPAVMPVLDAVMSRQIRLDQSYGFTFRKGTGGLDLHGGASPDAQGYDVSHGKIYSPHTVVGWALSDNDEGGGGFACVPGSHNSHLPKPSEISNKSGGRIELVRNPAVKAGDAVVFTENMIHGSLPWQHDHERIVLIYKYTHHNRIYARPRVPAAVIARMSPEHQQLLRLPWHEE